MKPSEQTYTRRLNTPYIAAALVWIAAVLLIAPNIALAVTETYRPIVKLTNIVLPLGVYLLLLSLSRRTGPSILWFIPVMALGAFQLVLLYLYGESIIAIDMFLNVTTTNVSEATELLGNLSVAVIAAAAIYLPLIVAGIILTAKHIRADRKALAASRLVGIILTISGAGMVGLCYLSGSRFSVTRHIFPVNVTCNIFEAANRTKMIANYDKTSADYTFHAHATHPDSLPEVYVMVVGETSRADNWQLLGYDRPTNPRLSRRNDIVVCSKALSESNTTHKSVPLLLSPLTAHSFGDSICQSKSIVSCFNECGYHTAWISDQQHNHSFIDFFSQEADETEYLFDDGVAPYDMNMVGKLNHLLHEHPDSKLFVVLHCYGSHFNYRERYPDGYDVFLPDNASDAKSANRPELLNAYNNSIRYTDAVLDSIIDVLAASNRPAVMVYTSDHGEDIFDDARERFLHASPCPTYWQLHVPMLMWFSEPYLSCWPQAREAARANADKNVSTGSCVYHTLMSVAGIQAPSADPTKALTEPDYIEPARVYLNDYNEAVPLSSCGLRTPDLILLSHHDISLY